jgi:hypothetical protein
MDFGLWSMVFLAFLGYVSVRRAPRAVNRRLDGRVGGRRRGRLCSLVRDVQIAKFVHTGLGSLYRTANDLHSPLPPREQLCNGSCKL